VSSSRRRGSRARPPQLAQERRSLGGSDLGIPLINANSMVGQEEHAYSLDHHGRRTQPNSTASGTTPLNESGKVLAKDR
jgi:hypothetical protein